MEITSQQSEKEHRQFALIYKKRVTRIQMENLNISNLTNHSQSEQLEYSHSWQHSERKHKEY